MNLFFIFLASTLLYSESKYSPIFLSENRFNLSKHIIRLISYSLFILSTVLLGVNFGLWTSFLIFTITWMLSMCLIIMIYPLNKKISYVFTGICVLIIIFENAL
jgi:hypothetical protein